MRRLAAILAADVVGYSRLMEQDETGTLAALKERRKCILAPLVSAHDGRIVKLMGDGVLVEFASAVNAVACAVDLQKKMAAANDGVADNRRIVLRIGINLGDVVVEGGDLYGDGVIIAVRLQAMAEPGGICLAGSVHEQVGNKLPLVFEDLGLCEMKNIAKPVRTFRVRVDHPEDVASSADRQQAQSKPSIAVLPFTNMSGDPTQAYFSDGITEDIITELTRYRQLFVIARNSSFAFRDKPVEITEVGRRLGVQYVVEGSVRKAAGRVRVTAQLVDSATGNHLWAERYDRDAEDIFAVQDDVTQNIVAALFGQVEDAGAQRAKRKRPESHAAYDYLLRGIELQQRQTKEDLSAARHMLTKAIEIDPDCPAAYAYMALVDQGEWDCDGSAASLDRALKNAHTAVALDEDDALCHGVMSYVSLLAKQLDKAEFHQLRALALNPNYAHMVAHMGLLSAYLGRASDGIQWLNKALRLNPYPPSWYRCFLGMTQYAAHDYAKAVASLNPMTSPLPWDRMYSAASYAQLDRLEEARAQLAEWRRLRSQGLLLEQATSEPFKNPADLEHLLDGLRKAGLSE
jgi:adenylate cyclase